MLSQNIAVECLESAAAGAAAAARRIRAAAVRSIAARGRFHLVLAGGTTPLAAYTLLADWPAEWEHWHIFLGDERCLSASDRDRNSVAAARVFFDRVPIPSANLHLMAAERGAEAAAAAYAAQIRPFLPFDLVLLGMGEDGHTASLFPGHEIPPGPLVIPVHGSPKPPPDRVSLTPRALAASRDLLILVTGAGKRKALDAWRQGADLPVARVASMGSALVLADRDALGTTGATHLPALE
jgi:6-phosphogluconolactonase